MILKRSFLLIPVFTLITFGFYLLYWFICMTNEAGQLADDSMISGGMALFLTIITFGIYQLYWSYKMGKLVSKIHEKNKDKPIDSSAAYLLLSLFGLSIVTYCLLQYEINKQAVDYKDTL